MKTRKRPAETKSGNGEAAVNSKQLRPILFDSFGREIASLNQQGHFNSKEEFVAFMQSNTEVAVVGLQNAIAAVGNKENFRIKVKETINIED